MQFLSDTAGNPLLSFDVLTPDDVVIVPAFGTTLEVEVELNARGVTLSSYNTTCPFVEKVWKRSQEIGKQDYTVVVHGKRYHEETRATFSHAQAEAEVVVVRDLAEAKNLAKVIHGEADADFFFEKFTDRYSDGFHPDIHLKRIGVVNQTTMLATETQAIADLLRHAIINRYGEENLAAHFADTKDTLCYATKENQDATLALIAEGGDVAVVVGGYNSSNTSHLVELCERKLPTYFVRDAEELLSSKQIRHLSLDTKAVQVTKDWLPTKHPDGSPVDIVLTAGASCPDILLDEVLRKIVGWFPDTRSVDEALVPYA